jgi:hypothetical protein
VNECEPTISLARTIILSSQLKTNKLWSLPTTSAGNNYSTAKYQTNGNLFKTNISDDMGLRQSSSPDNGGPLLWLRPSQMIFWALGTAQQPCTRHIKVQPRPGKAIAQIRYLHTQQDEVLTAYRSCMFMRNTEAELDSYIASRPTNKLLNWVNTW